MPDEEEGARRWIVEPPGPGEVAFHLSIGEGVELTEEQEQALSDFVKSLETSDAEVTGHGKTGPCAWKCTDHSCKPVKCATLICDGLTSELTASAGGSWSLMGSFSPRV